MSYLIGNFTRDYFDISENTQPMALVGIVDEIKKENLVRAQGDDDYQVINLITREYYDPKQNKWVPINRW